MSGGTCASVVRPRDAASSLHVAGLGMLLIAVTRAFTSSRDVNIRMPPARSAISRFAASVNARYGYSFGDTISLY